MKIIKSPTIENEVLLVDDRGFIISIGTKAEIEAEIEQLTKEVEIETEQLISKSRQ